MMSDKDKAAIEAQLAVLKSQPEAIEERHEVGAYTNMKAKNDKTGRHFLFSFPPDFSDEELFEIVGFLSGTFRKELEKLRNQPAVSRLVMAPPGMKIDH